MKWVLLWIAISPMQGLTSGSAPFETEKACLAGEQAFSQLLSDMQKSGGTRIAGFYPSELICVNTETGERKTNRLSLEEAQRRLRANPGSPR